VGRFVSADTVVPDFANPQSLNRYSYVLNSPLRYTDPTGHRECEDEFFVDCGGVDPIPAWDGDPSQYAGLTDQQAARAAYQHLMSDPLYFAALYVDPEAWSKSDEVTALELFAEYSTLHTTAKQLVLSMFDMESAEQLEAAWWQNLSNPGAITVLPSGALVGTAGVIAVIVPPIDPAIYVYATPPGPGWEWRGPATEGQWYNPETNEMLRIDYSHHGEVHYDIRAPDGTRYRLYLDGRIEHK
jgi:hypothetical protein